MQRQLSIGAEVSVRSVSKTTPLDDGFPAIGTWRSRGSRDRV